MDITVTMPVEAATKVPRSWAPWAGGTWTGPTGAADAPLPLIVTGPLKTGPLNMNVMVRCLGSRDVRLRLLREGGSASLVSTHF
jgi:hypothetical protein